MMKAFVQSFFYRTYESDLNERMLGRDFKLPEKGVKSYLNKVADTPCSIFVDFVLHDLARCGITTADIPQFSSWEEGTDNVCREVKLAGDQGYKHVGIGRLLFKDGKKRNEVAYRKYGEGHAKLARSLGLLQEIDKTYFLSCFGYVWGDVPRETRERLYTRFLLRFALIQYLLHETQTGIVEFKTVARRIGLSEWGCYRRHSNVMCVLDRLSSSKEYDFTQFRKRVNIETMLIVDNGVG